MFHLRKMLPECDKEEFAAEGVEYMDDDELFSKCLLGARTYLMKENPATIPQAKVHRER